MYYSGFADESGKNIETQITATKELGWNNIEARGMYGSNLGGITDAQFDDLCEKLDAAGIRINCYGSGIANWAKHPRKEEDFVASRTELVNALPRMQKLGVKMLRGMSFLVPKDEKPDSPELEAIIFRKLNELVKLCEDAGVIYGHENCMNYGGLSYRHTLKMLENVKSPNFKLIYDTGNPVHSDDLSKPAPYPKQSSWEFYSNVKEHVVYVHIKDSLWDNEKGALYTYPGEGIGDVERIVKDLLARGYDGGWSIEPHLAHVFHKPTDDDAAKQKTMYETYVEYGRRFMKIMERNISGK